ncbi:universal stress protein [Aquibium sp. ELW1220]|uniref:universal stress protein n=1 Tax=Aquibium sp. ELW1220 TaxID=2976766 RepID=UPI0025AF7657|nr:universal stress protein [Aquibium sp. ELW1220]MDN2579571.1 universal stress protein [Aquibium sp. ELW1220]
MSYRSILVQIDIDGATEPRIRFAKEIARRFDAALIGYCAAQPHPAVAPMDGAIVAGELIRRETEEIQARLDEIARVFAEMAGIDSSFRGMVGDPTRSLTELARLADLIVAGPRDEHQGRDGYRAVDLGALILSAGRPVLVTTRNQAALKGDRLLVAWKDTREARRAVVDSLPFLKTAHEVNVVTVEEDDRAHARESLADVVAFLAAHGVKARSECLMPADEEFGDTLSTTAFEMGADLVVSGGYGHSRLREWAFGGVTRRLIEASSTNRLFSN